jgi:hypothetical protein
MVAEVLPDTVDFGSRLPVARAWIAYARQLETPSVGSRCSPPLPTSESSPKDGAREGFADALAGNTELLTRT